jgi:hypothetical protein
LALNEVGRYTAGGIDEVGVRVFTVTDEIGLEAFGLAVAAVVVTPAFQPNAFQEPEAFQTLAGIVVLSQPNFGEFYDWWEPPEEAFWAVDVAHISSLDITPFFFPLIVAGDEIPAAQRYDEDYQWTLLDEDWSASVFGFPDQALDPVPALFPPDVTTDFLATQLDPSIGQDDQYLEPQTEDYQADSTIDVAWSMDFASGDEISIATQPLSEQPWFPEQETEDYQQDSSLDVTAAFFPPVAVDDGYIGTTALQSDQTFDPEPEFEWAPFLEQNEGFLSPNDAFDVTISTQYPLAEQPWFPDQDIDTELQNDSTLETIAQFFPPDVTTDFLATQPLAEQPWYPDQETEDYANDSTVDTSWSMDFASGDEITIATQPLAEFPEFPDDLSQFDTPYVEQNEGYLSPSQFAPDEILAAQPLLEPYQAYPDPELEDYQQFADQIEGYLSPNDAPDVTTAATWFLPEHPEPEPDFIPDAATDQVEALSGIAADDSYIAALDIPTDLQWPTEDDAFDWGPSWLRDGVTAFLAGDDGQYAAQDLPDQIFEFTDPEQPEQPQTPLDVDWFQAVPIDNTVIAATQPLAEQWWYPEQETEDYFQPPNLEVVGQFSAPPPPSGTGPDFFTAVVRPRWELTLALRWTASSKKRWASYGRTRWQATGRSRFS